MCMSQKVQLKLTDMNEEVNVPEEAGKHLLQFILRCAKAPCDDTVDSFNKDADLPPFFDEELFKRGQAFYHRNIFALFTGKLFGLIAVLSIPTILQILIHTKMSGTNMTAYRRYVATLFHMNIWYDADFKPGSKLWQSLREVKNLHNSASNKGCKAGLKRISQKDMALTQFGFMGFQLTRNKLIGVYDATPEDWAAFIHLWRVVGYLLGIEDRFNICSGSVPETKAICEKLIQRVFIPHIKQNDSDFLQMSRYLVNGLWAVNPMLNFNVIMCSLQFLLVNQTNFEFEEYKRLHFWEKWLIYFFGFIRYTLKWTPFRWYHNHTKYRDFWLIKNFPFLAYYKFGYKNARVRILGKEM